MRYAALYLATGRSAILAPSLHTESGIGYEADEAFLLADWREPVRLAEAIWTALARYSIKPKDLRDSKTKDWAAYRASSCRSVADFERTYLRIHISAVNNAELIYEAIAKPVGEEDLSVRFLFNPSDHERLGLGVLRLYHVCSVWYERLEDMM